MINMIIDPLNITTADEIAVISQLFRSSKNEIIKRKGKSYLVEPENTETVKLSSTVIKMHEKYYVMNNVQLNEKTVPTTRLYETNAITRVFAITKAFKIVNDSIEYTNLPYPLLVKFQKLDHVQEEDYLDLRNRLRDEYEYIRTISHLGVIGALLENEKNTLRSYILMQRMPGEELFYTLNNLESHESLIIIKLLITLNVLYAYMTQVLNYERSHNDIKPENIVVVAPKMLPYSHKQVINNRLFIKMLCNIIDYGNCQMYDEPRILPSYTKEYASPELIASLGNLFEPNNEKSDLYSLGVVIQEIWGINPGRYYCETEVHNLHDEKYGTEKGFSVALLLEIYSITYQMKQQNPEKRPNFKQVLDKFEAITTQYYLARMEYMVENRLGHEIQALIENNPKLINLRSKRDNITILIYASYYKCPEIIHYLIRSKADLNEKVRVVEHRGRREVSLLKGALDFALLSKKNEDLNLYTILILLEAGAKLFYKDNMKRYGETAYQSTIIQDTKEHKVWKEQLLPVNTQLPTHKFFRPAPLLIQESDLKRRIESMVITG